MKLSAWRNTLCNRIKRKPRVENGDNANGICTVILFILCYIQTDESYGNEKHSDKTCNRESKFGNWKLPLYSSASLATA